MDNLKAKSSTWVVLALKALSTLKMLEFFLTLLCFASLPRPKTSWIFNSKFLCKLQVRAKSRNSSKLAKLILGWIQAVHHGEANFLIVDLSFWGDVRAFYGLIKFQDSTKNFGLSLANATMFVLKAKRPFMWYRIRWWGECPKLG